MIKRIHSEMQEKKLSERVDFDQLIDWLCKALAYRRTREEVKFIFNTRGNGVRLQAVDLFVITGS